MPEITIGKTRYTVSSVDRYPGKARAGCIDYERLTIEIARHGGVSGRRYSRKEMANTFWHEIVHGILRDLGRHQDNSNEQLVDGIALRVADVVRQLYGGDGIRACGRADPLAGRSDRPRSGSPRAAGSGSTIRQGPSCKRGTD
jgi:hypothetical protein